MLQIPSHPEWHPVFEGLGYVSGFAAYRRQRMSAGDVLSSQQRWTVIAAAVLGALVGSRLLGLLEHVPLSQLSFSQLLSPGGGKTIVGGLLAGWLGVEIAKKLNKIDTRTGDLFAVPLCVGIGVGRVGCLLAGLVDDTYGKPTSLWWGVDFGDGIMRHPTQAYEIVFLVILALALRYAQHLPRGNGALFRTFMTAYLSWRLMIDWLKPEPVIGGLSVIQWACVIGLIFLVASWKGSSLRMNGGTANYA